MRNSYQSSKLISRSAATVHIFTKRCGSTECASRRDQDAHCRSSHLTMALLIGLCVMHTNMFTKMDPKLVMPLTRVKWCIFSLYHSCSLCPQELSCFNILFLFLGLWTSSHFISDSRPMVKCWILTCASCSWISSNVEIGQLRCT